VNKMPMMPYSKNSVISNFLYALYAIVMATIYGLFTYFGIFARGSEGFALRTYIWNLVLITMVLFVDKIYLSRLRASTKKRNALNKKSKVLHFVSFKASLYLFYMFALSASRLLLLLDTGELVTTDSFWNYLLSIEYGLILLVAADKFIGQFVKDKKQMKELAESQL